MEKLIIIKYGELSTKKDNINFFLKILKSNIEEKLNGLDYNIYYDHGRMFIEGMEVEKIKEKLKYIFGIHEVVVGYKSSDTSIDDIKQNILELLEEKSFNTFKVITKRSDKTYPYDSMKVSRIIGGNILASKDNVSVDVHNPELVVNIEIRSGEVLYYFDSVPGPGGYPVGTQGKGLLMLSGGIDSPVAGYLAMKRGVRIEAIYFESPPHTSESAKEKVKSLAKELSKYNLSIKLHVINFTKIQEEILKNIPKDYLVTIMRRMMYRISESVATKNNCKVIINGESIGQVASQTLTSMSCINEVVSMPVIRPVACLDKLEIIDIAKKINTYETSILPYEDCCTIFVPKHPVINPSISKCIEYEKLIPYEDYINEAISNMETITINESDSYKYSDLL